MANSANYNGPQAGAAAAQPSTTNSIHLATVPGSPTLTNPDMILPDYNDPDSPLSQQLARSPKSMWRNGQFSDMEFQIHPPESFVAGPATLGTPIIYGNGTMLSDIGEVTEVESNAGYSGIEEVRRVSVQKFTNPVLRSFSSNASLEVKKISREQIQPLRKSIDSTSTITDHENPNRFADFDDSFSVDDSNFQGDDEESTASSFKDDIHAGDVTNGQVLKNMNGIAAEEHNANIISQRAEEILANAKQRLTTLGGNLSRARSTLSNSSVSDGSTPSPSTQRPAQRPATSLREFRPFGLHSRDTSSDNSSSGRQRVLKLQRSASALGSAGGYRQPQFSKQEKGFKGPLYKVTQTTLNTTLESADEDEVFEDASILDPNGGRASSHSTARLTPSPTPSNAYLDAGAPRASSVAQVRDIQDQMNGLKGKISSLREQALADRMKRRSLQSLRNPSPFTHARFENGLVEPRSIKRAEANAPIATEYIKPPPGSAADVNDAAHQESGTMLRTEAEQHATAPKKVYEDVDEEVQEPAREKWDPICLDRADQESVTEEIKSQYGATPKQDLHDYEKQPQWSRSGAVQNEYEDARTENGDSNGIHYPQPEGYASPNEEERQGETNEHRGLADDRSEAGESTYHDSYPSLSHEDREDAFDYEHFFLHSAMGTLSRQGFQRTESVGSYDSEDSVETTRGPSYTRERRPSVDTMSTVNTFATALEGRVSRSSAPSRSDTRQSNVQPVEELDEIEEDGAVQNFGLARAGTSTWRESRQHFDRVTHRPSVSSFDSTGTTRSFPLISKPKVVASQITPEGTPDSELKRLSRALIGETVSLLDKEEAKGFAKSEAIHSLSRHDQTSVQMLLASLGKCVLGMGELSQNGSGLDVYRERIESARRILEGREV